MFPLISIFALQHIFHAVAALFSVEVPRASFTVSIGNTVAMQCNFPVEDTFRNEHLMITWIHGRPSQMDKKEVYVFYEGLEDLSKQDTSYRGRATLQKDQLSTGRAVLQISNVKLTDRGTYSCIIGYGGADYKHIDLIVEAPYKKIHTYSEVAPGGKELALTCHSEGFPMADVFWQYDRVNISMSFNTTHTLTADGLYNVTSTLRSKLRPEKNYSCLFWNEELQEITSAEIFPSVQQDVAVAETSLYLIIIPICIFLIGTCAVIISRRKSRSRYCGRKGIRNTSI